MPQRRREKTALVTSPASWDHKQIYEQVALSWHRHRVLWLHGQFSLGVAVEVVDEGGSVIVGGVVVQLEVGAVGRADVLGVGEAVEVVLEGCELVVPALVEGEDGDGVIGLHGVGVGGVVDEEGAGEVAVEFREVLDEEVGGELAAVLAVEAVVDQLVLGVELIEDGVRVALVAGREHHDLPPLLHPPQEGDRVGADIDAHLEGEAVDADRQLQVASHAFVLLEAMDQRLVQIEDQRFFVLASLYGRQPYLGLVLEQRLLIELAEAVLEQHLDGLANVLEGERALLVDGPNALGEVVFGPGRVGVVAEGAYVFGPGHGGGVVRQPVSLLELALTHRLLRVSGGRLLQALHRVHRGLHVALLLLRLARHLCIFQLFLNLFKLPFYCTLPRFRDRVELFGHQQRSAAILFERGSKAQAGKRCG